MKKVILLGLVGVALNTSLVYADSANIGGVPVDLDFEGFNITASNGVIVDNVGLSGNIVALRKALGSGSAVTGLEAINSKYAVTVVFEYKGKAYKFASVEPFDKDALIVVEDGVSQGLRLSDAYIALFNKDEYVKIDANTYKLTKPPLFIKQTYASEVLTDIVYSDEMANVAVFENKETGLCRLYISEFPMMVKTTQDWYTDVLVSVSDAIEGKGGLSTNGVDLGNSAISLTDRASKPYIVVDLNKPFIDWFMSESNAASADSAKVKEMLSYIEENSKDKAVVAYAKQKLEVKSGFSVFPLVIIGFIFATLIYIISERVKKKKKKAPRKILEIEGDEEYEERD